MPTPLTLTQDPAPGTHRIAYRGDTLRLALSLSEPCRGTAFVRTTVGRAATSRAERIARVEQDASVMGRAWHDIAMRRVSDAHYEIVLPLLEVGRVQAKCCFLPEGQSHPLWPEGPNLVFKVEPAAAVCGNTMYTAFVRQFGPNRETDRTHEADRAAIDTLEASGYTVIPPSGTFRDLIRHLDTIVGTMRFRIVQLLPIHPVPTTYARMGRFGSPFAALDFFDVDPALAEFDRRTTPLQQFDELVDAVHRRDARLFLDIPVNHTGWASRLHLEHPEWFARDEQQSFASPGAWGITWEDLSELNYRGHRDLWKYMAEVFLFWCRRGVDGFRCDAGYKLPREAWVYLVARVRSEAPATVFLLEGLGGKWSTVEALLDDANLDWAYSELFQNYDRANVEAHLRYCLEVSRSRGTLLHYAETHDNNRLAATSPSYARLRTALAALCSEAGAFGLTNGAEWYADAKVDVHGASALRWGAPDNMVDHLRRLNTLLHTHPCFEAGADLRLIDTGPHNTVALLRVSHDGADRVLVLANLDATHSVEAAWPAPVLPCGAVAHDLLSGTDVALRQDGDTRRCPVGPEEVRCLSIDPECPAQLEADIAAPHLPAAARDRQRIRAKALEVYTTACLDCDLGDIDLDDMTDRFRADPHGFCARLRLTAGEPDEAAQQAYAPVVRWHWPEDIHRTVMIPPGHFLLIEGPRPFAARLMDGDRVSCPEESLPCDDNRHIALFLPQAPPGSLRTGILQLRMMEPDACRHERATVMYLPAWRHATVRHRVSGGDLQEEDVVGLLANEGGTLSHVRAAWGVLRSKYDALLAANLDPTCPSDRVVMWVRCRLWLVCKGYSQPLDHASLDAFERVDNRCVAWHFRVPAHDGQTVVLSLRLHLDPDRNAVRLVVQRHAAGGEADLPDAETVRLIARPDLADRSQHAETKAWAGPETTWPRAVRAQPDGFCFGPAADHQLFMRLPGGQFVTEPEWTYSVHHPEETERGLEDHSDLFSPGYLAVDLAGGAQAVLSADVTAGNEVPAARDRPPHLPAPHSTVDLKSHLAEAMEAYIVRRNRLKTIIAGYPWFLDWGRDTLICLRGLIAAGRRQDAQAILKAFAQYEQNGTLPNMIRGTDVSDRDTSDAPLWFLVACGDLLRHPNSAALLQEDCGGRSLHEVMRSIVDHYCRGTPNGIRMDAQTGLVFSPAHFTWMDTNYPAGTPRQGYPVELQALWIAGLDLLNSIRHDSVYDDVRTRARQALVELYPIERHGETYLSDCLHARTGQGAREAVADDALRPNQLFAITLGTIRSERTRRSILEACQRLLVPGAIRSLADLAVRPPLRIAHGGQVLGDPDRPYHGRYTGDEDTSRKPAYHNGTAWGWPFPSYCEALFLTYGAPVRDTALNLMGSCGHALNRGCLGQLPEILDGDTPHAPKGCGAQAWSVTETYRVIAKLQEKE